MTDPEAMALLRAASLDPRLYYRVAHIPERPTLRTTDPAEGYRVNRQIPAHFKAMMSAMIRCNAKDKGRLLVVAPPGVGKSVILSCVMPGFFMGNFRGYGMFRYMQIAYAGGPIKKFADNLFESVRFENYNKIFGLPEFDQRQPIRRFKLANNSEYIGLSLDGSVTSESADFLGLDDPVKGVTESKSKATMATVTAKIQSDAQSRLRGEASMMMGAARQSTTDYHSLVLDGVKWEGESYLDDDDFVARGGKRSIRLKDGYDWEILSMPAIWYDDLGQYPCPLGRKPGDAIWPEYLKPDHFLKWMHFPHLWHSLAQGRPNSTELCIFATEQIGIWQGDLPSGFIYTCRGWDVAYTQNGGDYTAGFKMLCVRLIGGDKIYLLADLEIGQYAVGKRDNIIMETIATDGWDCHVCLPRDPGAGDAQVNSWTEKLNSQIHGPVTFETQRRDKLTRAMPFATAVANGQVHRLQGLRHWDKIEEQFRTFTGEDGQSDDIVDAASSAFNTIVAHM